MFMATSEPPRVVVTGMGMITPLGCGVGPCWERLVSGQSGTRSGRLTHCDTTDWPVTIGGYIDDFDPTMHMSAKAARRTARFTQFAVAAADEALADAGLDLSHYDPTRVGIEMGNAVGDIATITQQYDVLQERGPRRIRPHTGPSVLINMGGCQLAIRYGIKGPIGTPVAACATGLYAVGNALRRIQRGEADVVIAGASEAAVTPPTLGAFWRIGALSTRNDEPARACRPFAEDRDGTVIAEGAAVLILEREDVALMRSARIYGEIAGYGISADGYHLIAPDPKGDGAARAMTRALRDAGLAPAAINWISAHGTATALNDVAETRAIKQVFGDEAYAVPVSSIKSMIGHTLGAAGAISVAATLTSLDAGTIPPTIRFA